MPKFDRTSMPSMNRQGGSVQRTPLNLLEYTVLSRSPARLGRDEAFKKRQTEAQVIRNMNEQLATLFFRKALSDLQDPRRRQGRRYPLITVVIVALMASICGADDALAFESWGNSREDWLKTFLDMPYGAPTQDVYLEVLAALDPNEFGNLFRAWTELILLHLKRGKQDIGAEKKNVSIDGKTSRRSYDRIKGKAAIHTVSAWSRENGVVLGQVKTETKSNEITAIPELLHRLDLKNVTITIDAMGCQTEIANIISQRGGYFLLGVKNNQPKLHHNIETAFNYVDLCKKRLAQGLELPLPSPTIEAYAEVDKGHGRLEERTIEICRSLDWLGDKLKEWPHITYFVRVRRKRTILSTGKTSDEVAYYIGSHASMDAKTAAESIRGHWSIENNLHWVLDMAFGDDNARHRAGNTADNFAILRHFALNLIKADKTRKLGVANSRKMAGWNNDYLMTLLMGVDAKDLELLSASNFKAAVKKI